jgi:hypothetical protein
MALGLKVMGGQQKTESILSGTLGRCGLIFNRQKLTSDPLVWIHDKIAKPNEWGGNIGRGIDPIGIAAFRGWDFADPKNGEFFRGG